MATEGSMADRSGDVEFLQQQVQRLNAVLSQYQNKYKPPGPQDEQAVPLIPHGHHTSWLTDKRLLTPLLTEYDNVIAQLQHNISTYQAELLSLNSRVEDVTAENARLYQELRELTESQLINKEREEEAAQREKTTALTALQNQLAAISKDRDNFREKWRQTTFELEHLQKNDQVKKQQMEKYKSDMAKAQHTALSLQKKVEELQTACVKMNEERSMCMETAQAGEQEVEELGEILSNTRSEYKALQMRNAELLRVHNELTQQLRRNEEEKQVLDGQGLRIDGRVHLLELANTELEAKLVAALSEVATLSKEKTGLEESVTIQQSRLAVLEREVHEAVGHVKESMEMVESAILDKDQAVIVSQQQAQEAERLRAAMEALLQEAGQRTRKEVDAVRAEYNKNIDKMAEEIQKLEDECGQKQALLERAQREKKAAERELEIAHERVTAEATKAKDTLQQMQNRVHEAERAGEEAYQKMDTALMAQRTAEASLTEEKRHCEELSSELGRRVKEGEEEGRRVILERKQFAEQLQEMRKQLREEIQAREAAERRAKQELAVVLQHYELRERELQCRLQTREQTHNKSTAELRELLTSQHRMGTRWREESKSLTQKFEETINNLRTESTGYRRQREVLKVEVDTLTKAKQHQSEQLKRLQSSQSHFQQQLKEAENRADAATAQVSSLLMREQQLLAEKRELHRQLDKLKLEIARRAGMVLAIPSLSVPPNPSLLPATTTPLNNSSAHLNTSSAPLNISSAPLDATGWGQALSGLHQSIRRVRRELEETQGEHTPAPGVTGTQPLTRHQHQSGVSAAVSQDSSSFENSVISEHSPLHRADLSHTADLL